MEFRADDGQAFSIQALLDPGSYSIHNDKSSLDENVSIVSYVSEEVANLIANKTQKNKLRACACKPAKTCSATGCFISTRCITVTCRLIDSIASTDEIQLSFRVVKTLNDNKAIIGLNDVRRYDLTKRFRHLFVDGQGIIDEYSQQDNLDKIDAHEENSTSDEEGEDEGNYSQQKKPSRRTIMSQHTSDSELNPPDVYSHSSSGSQPDNDKTHASMMELHMNYLSEGNLIRKDDILTPEDDTDYIDDYIASNVVEDLYNADIEDDKTLDNISIETIFR